MNLQERARLDGPRGWQVIKALPYLLDYRTVLYIGANPKRFQLYGLLPRDGLYVVEIFGPYVLALRASKQRPCAGVFIGDVRNLDAVPEIRPLKPFDLVVWWHGPEHVTEGEARELLRPEGPLRGWWRRAILLGCPWGRYEQAVTDGNAHQAHRWSIEPDFFDGMGYSWSVIGQKDAPGSNLIAWRAK